MDFVRYAESGADLINARPDDVESLRAHLAGRAWLGQQVTEKDVAPIRRFVGELRSVFAAGDEGEVDRVVSELNRLLSLNPMTPMISRHDRADLHLHVATRSASVAELLISESLLGLAMVVCDLGATRLGVCSAGRCDRAYVDTSPNRSRRYCSDRCSSRANVAAFRARQRARSTQTEAVVRG